MMKSDLTLKCCDEMIRYSGAFAWAIAGTHLGAHDVEIDGWAMEAHSHGDAVFISIKFCPFCGVQLSTLEDLTSNS